MQGASSEGPKPALQVESPMKPFARSLSMLMPLALMACGSEPEAAGPNVVLISIDTLRPDHLGCYGYMRRTSPVIDGLAANGMLFEQHISSAPWTLPAHAAMFTSVPDSVHGVVDPIGVRLSEAFETLPESFQNAGYRTAGFFAGPYLHPAFGLGQGFDSYEDCVQVSGEEEVDQDNAWSMRDPVLRASHHGVTNDKVYSAWSKFIESAGPPAAEEKESFFAFVHLWDVHFDFAPPEPYDTMFDPDYEGRITGRDFFYDPEINAAMPERDKQHIIALYDGEIAWTDFIVGKIKADLEARGLLANTIIVITSDHGTELFDHGHKGHRSQLYEEQIHIPLVIHYPGTVRRGKHAGLTRMIDLGPTLRELANLPAVGTSLGESLAPIARGEIESRRAPPAVSELMSVGRNLRSVRTETDKVIHNATADRYWWFDLVVDGDEMVPKNLGADARSTGLLGLYREVQAELTAAIETRPGAAEQATIPAMVLQSLQANGYVNPGVREDEPDDGTPADRDSDDGAPVDGDR